MKIHTFRQEMTIPRSLTEVFAFFSDARNLSRLTPEYVGFEILTKGEIIMQPGTIIDYRIRMHGVPMRWQSEITVWESGVRFVDEQRKGPFRMWHHEHAFEADTVDGVPVTRMTDTVRYATWLDAVVHRCFVRPQVETIFAFRTKGLDEVFPRSITNVDP